jgi:DNA ligase-1
MKVSELASLYDTIAAARSDPKRTAILSDLFHDLDEKTLRAVAHLTAGEVVDPALSDVLGIGPGTIRDALADLAGVEPAAIEDELRRTGDISGVAARVVDGKDAMTVTDLWSRVNRAVKRGEDRRKLLEYIYARSNANGARYVTRMLLGQMRIGVGYGTLARAIASAFDVDESDVQRLFALSNDIGLTAVTARRGAASMARTGLALFRPYQFMNAEKVGDAGEIFERLQDRRIIFEVKYDGARLQIHIDDGTPRQIKLYSRRLNDVTDSLPDVVAALRKAWKGGAAIIEGEAVAYDKALTEKQPFQMVLTRLGRKHDIEEAAKNLPFILYLFDIVYDDGEILLDEPQKARRARLAKHFRPSTRVKMTESVVTEKMADAKSFFTKAIEEGMEGLMAKDPDACYIPGKRLDNWMKLKPAFETLDVVIVGGIWGSGRRKGTLSSLVVAVRDKDDLKTVGKVGTGFSEAMLADLTARLEPLIISTKGRNVEIEPKIVIEVDFQGIQKTSAYDSGYALRIPRFKQERADKSIREADTLARLKQLYAGGRG